MLYNEKIYAIKCSSNTKGVNGSVKKEITLEVIISYERSYSYKTVEKLRTISRKIDKKTVKELIKNLEQAINE